MARSLDPGQASAWLTMYPLVGPTTGVILGMRGDREYGAGRGYTEGASSRDVNLPEGKHVSSVQDEATTRPAHEEAVRVLIPVDATERSRWPIRRALAEHRAGAKLDVHLLHVAEPIVAWQVLRFRTQAEIAKFQATRAGYLLEDAARPVRDAGIDVTVHFREGDIASLIIDVSEQLGCGRIWLPMPPPRWQRLFSRDIVREIVARKRASHVDIVDESGSASRQ